MKDESTPALSPELLLRAYASGVFPMAESADDPDIFWLDPAMRGIFPLDGFHCSRSLARHIKRQDYSIRLNTDFSSVLDACADRPETWINDTIRNLYLQLHWMRHAHSLEVWQNKYLIGGVYGVTLGSAFFGESMFSHQANASKVALAYLTNHLKRCGFTLFDTQFLTPHLASLGAIEISRAEYHDKLKNALRLTADIGTAPDFPTGQELMQRNTHKS